MNVFYKFETSSPVVGSQVRPATEGTIYLEDDGTVNVLLDNDQILGINQCGIWVRDMAVSDIINDHRYYKLAPEGFKVSLIQHLAK